MNRWTIESLSPFIDPDYIAKGSNSISINNVAPIDMGKSSDLSFCSSEDYQGIMSILRSNSGIILCKKSIGGFVYSDIQKSGENCSDNKNPGACTNFDTKNNENKKQLLVFVDNPRLSFIRIAKIIKKTGETKRIRKNNISSHAAISESAIVGRDCYIGDFAVIGENCTIGSNTIIESRVTLQNCQIGDNCIIQSGTVIGQDGFSFERAPDTLKLESFPHYGKVIIKDNVEIFANCSIARGSITDTIIQSGSKIDALCHIAHNVCIGTNTELTAGTVIGGSTTVGNNCWLGLNCTLKNKIKVGDKVIVGSGSSVIYDVMDEDIVAGAPAKSIKNKVTADKDKLFLMAGQCSKV